MTDLDWSKWHKLAEPKRTPGWSDARVTISCAKNGLLSIGFNAKALQDIGLVDDLAKGSIRCDIFEGIGDHLGKLLVRWSDKGAYQVVPSFKGKVGRIMRIETDWAPEDQQKSQACKHVVIDGVGLEIELPGWFDRELYREAERREAAE